MTTAFWGTGVTGTVGVYPPPHPAASKAKNTIFLTPVPLISITSRGDRWKLITAYVNKGQWPQAKREIAAILNDGKPTNEERVRGANFYRQQEERPGLAQIDYVLKVEPTNPAAVVTRAYILLQDKQPDRAATILRTGIELTAKTGKATPPAVFYLMLAAVENETPPATDALVTSPQGPRRRAEDPSGGPGAGPGAVRRPGRRRAAAGEALAFVEAKAKEEPKGPFRQRSAAGTRPAPSRS